MPLVKKELTLAAGATSEQILAGTTYEYVGPNTRLVVAAGASANHAIHIRARKPQYLPEFILP